jgi:tetratricopeptide (TPR) repeat protein
MTTEDMDEARKLYSLAGESIQKQDFNAALAYFSKAIDHLPEDEKEARARIFNNMGHASVRLRKFNQALDLFKEAADLFMELGDEMSLGEQFGNIGSVHRDMNEWDLALSNYFDSLEIFEKIDRKAGIAAQYSNIS